MIFVFRAQVAQRILFGVLGVLSAVDSLHLLAQDVAGVPTQEDGPVITRLTQQSVLEPERLPVLAQEESVTDLNRATLQEPDRAVAPASFRAASFPVPSSREVPIGPMPAESIRLQNGLGQLSVSGAISLLGVNATDRAFVPWNPLFMLPPSLLGDDNATFELHGRQSNLQFLYAGPKLGQWDTGAFAKFYFTNSTMTSDVYGFMPVVAFGEVRNEHFRLSAGLQPDLFAPRDPVVIPLTLMGGTGNAGTFRGQLRGEAYWKPSESLQGTLQAAISDPISTILIDASRRSTESDGLPNFELRGALGVGELEGLAGGRRERPLEVGVAGMVGRIRNSQIVYDLDDIDPAIPIRSVIDIGGMSVDTKINLTDRIGVIGEGYFGQGLGTYAGTIFQTFNSQTYRALRGQGGFLEAFVYLTNRLHVHGGYGVEGPLRRDLPVSAGSIVRNSAYYSSLFWDISQSVQYSFQVDYRETDFLVLQDNSGWIFYNQLAFRF